jgi:hypothetical protein
LLTIANCFNDLVMTMTWGRGGYAKRWFSMTRGAGGSSTPVKLMTSFLNSPLYIYHICILFPFFYREKIPYFFIFHLNASLLNNQNKLRKSSIEINLCQIKLVHKCVNFHWLSLSSMLSLLLRSSNIEVVVHFLEIVFNSTCLTNNLNDENKWFSDQSLYRKIIYYKLFWFISRAA